MPHREIRRRVEGFLRARVIGASLATIGFAGWALVEPGIPSWSLVAGTALFTLSSWAQLRRAFANSAVGVMVDSAIIFGTILVARPFPGVEATALALMMTSAIVFGTPRTVRWLVPSLATAAAAIGVVNWVLRPPPGWSSIGMVVNACVAIAAVFPMILWISGFIARASLDGLISLVGVGDPEAFANTVTETVSEGIAVIDVHSTIRYANPAFCGTFGFAPEELIGFPLALVMDEETYRRHDAALTAALGSGDVVHATNLELVGRHRDGHPVTVLVSLSELADQGERLVLGAVRDVSEMVELRSQLQRLVAAKDEFIATVSHELRTPLTAVVAYSEMLLNRAELDAGEEQEFVELVADQAREMSYLVEDLLIAARIETDSLSFVTRPTSVRTEVLSAAGPWATHRSLEIDHASLDRIVHADPGRLRQVIRNLVSNAVKYGGDEVGISAESDEDGMCQVIVRDNGPGVSPANEHLIFEAYEHSRDVDGQPASMGLGLFVSRRLAEMMGGSLHYRRHGGVTEFVLRVPMADDRGVVTVSDR